MNQEKIGSFIREKRLEKNLTQKELADKLYITVQAISKWERGKGIPDVSILEELASILDVSIVEILKGEEVEDKDDKNIIETLGYAKKNYIQNFRSIIMKFCWAVLILVIIITVMPTLFVKIVRNRTYSLKEDFYNIEEMKTKNEKTLYNYNILKQNQGNYSDTEYGVILRNIEIYEASIKSNNNIIEIANKSEIKISDVVDYLNNFESIDDYLYPIEANTEDLEAIVIGRSFREDKEPNLFKINVNYLFDLDTFTYMSNYREYKRVAGNSPIELIKYFTYIFVDFHNDASKKLLELGGYCD